MIFLALIFRLFPSLFKEGLLFYGIDPVAFRLLNRLSLFNGEEVLCVDCLFKGLLEHDKACCLFKCRPNPPLPPFSKGGMRELRSAEKGDDCIDVCMRKAPLCLVIIDRLDGTVFEEELLKVFPVSDIEP